MSAERARIRSRIGNLTRHGGGSPGELTDLQREYAALKIADVIKEVVASAPPLTQAQKDRLAALLNTAGREASGKVVSDA